VTKKAWGFIRFCIGVNCLAASVGIAFGADPLRYGMPAILLAVGIDLLTEWSIKP
jgi:phosphate/sulfate permease